MNSEIKMNVSSITRKDGEKAVYVLFTDNKKMAEFILPEMKLVSNNGFLDMEIDKLREYIQNESDYIYSISKNVNPLKGFLNMEQGIDQKLFNK